jgi:hypothetical protein
MYLSRVVLGTSLLLDSEKWGVPYILSSAGGFTTLAAGFASRCLR